MAPFRPVSSRRAAFAALAVTCAALPVRAQRSESAPRAPLPAAFAGRADGPYIGGTIVERTQEAPGRLRVHVVAGRGPAAIAGRATHAEILVSTDSLLAWRDGTRARFDDLVVGRSIVVWVRGPEPRTDPPLVTSSAMLVERR